MIANKASGMGRARGRAKALARSNARFDRLVFLSRQGVTKADAAEDIGLTPDGASTLIRKKLGTAKWPIPEELL